MGKKFALEDYDAIAKWWAGEIEDLHGQQFELYARLDLCHNFMAKYGPGKPTTEKLLKHYKAKDIPYDRRQAVRDQDYTSQLFNTQRRDMKKMYELYAIDKIQTAMNYAMKHLKDDPYKLAMAVGKLAKELRETVGYDKQHLELPDFENMGGNEYLLTQSPEDAGFTHVEVTDELKRKYAMHKSEMQAEDVEYKEINE